ncbi:MAG: hypothetical protein JWQ35_694 [Bacteriovoracaceae bacterium]|nr:hypothetical protein [Bacteriovoracaceae bacterium]
MLGVGRKIILFTALIVVFTTQSNLIFGEETEKNDETDFIGYNSRRLESNKWDHGVWELLLHLAGGYRRAQIPLPENEIRLIRQKDFLNRHATFYVQIAENVWRHEFDRADRLEGRVLWSREWELKTTDVQLLKLILFSETSKYQVITLLGNEAKKFSKKYFSASTDKRTTINFESEFLSYQKSISAQNNSTEVPRSPGILGLLRRCASALKLFR